MAMTPVGRSRSFELASAQAAKGLHANLLWDATHDIRLYQAFESVTVLDAGELDEAPWKLHMVQGRPLSTFSELIPVPAVFNSAVRAFISPCRQSTSSTAAGSAATTLKCAGCESVRSPAVSGRLGAA